MEGRTSTCGSRTSKSLTAPSSHPREQVGNGLGMIGVTWAEKVPIGIEIYEDLFFLDPRVPITPRSVGVFRHRIRPANTRLHLSDDRSHGRCDELRLHPSRGCVDQPDPLRISHLGSPGALTGASNQVLFTAGTHLCVHAERYVVFSNSVSGALSLAGYGAVTQSKLRTIGGGDVPHRPHHQSHPLGQLLQRRRHSWTNATYNFERTVDLTNWTSFQSLVPTSTNIQAVVDLSPPNGPAFYRFRRE